MDCNQCRDLISRSLTDALTQMETEQMQRHIKECPACAEEEAALRKLLYDLAALDEGVEAPPALMESVRGALSREHIQKATEAPARKHAHKPVWRIVGSVAAALAVLVLGGSVLAATLSGNLGAKGMSSGAPMAAEPMAAAPLGGVYYTASADTGSNKAMEEAAGYGMYDAAEVEAPAAAEPMEAASQETMNSGALPAATAAPVPSPEEGTGAEYGEKIIRNAEISAQTENFDADLEAFTQLVQSLGGYITSQYNNGTPLSEGDYGSGRWTDITARVPAQQLDNFLTQTQGLGAVQYSNVYSEDVTSAYYDTDRRLQGYQVQYDRILALMEKAETVEELISIESELTRLEYQIDSLTGTIQMYDNQVSYSTVNYNLQEVRRASAVSPTLRERMDQSLQNTFDNFVLGSQDFVVWLYGALPVIGGVIVLCAIAAVVLILCLRRKKAPKKGKKADKADKPE